MRRTLPIHVDTTTTRDSGRSRRRQLLRLLVVVILAELTCILPAQLAIRSTGESSPLVRRTRNFSLKAAPRAIPVVDLDLRRLTVTGIPGRRRAETGGDGRRRHGARGR